MKRPKHESVLEQLKDVSKVIDDLIYYEYDVSMNNIEDAIFYSKLQDTINDKIKEIEAK